LESDFSDESYSIYILDREDMYEIRGYEVVWVTDSIEITS
jgi:hypothetical protein